MITSAEQKDISAHQSGIVKIVTKAFELRSGKVNMLSFEISKNVYFNIIF